MALLRAALLALVLVAAITEMASSIRLDDDKDLPQEHGPEALVKVLADLKGSLAVCGMSNVELLS